MITLVPIGGLANRMRAVVAAFRASEKISQPLRIVWQDTDNCSARFDQLFEPLEGTNFNIVAGSFRDTPATHNNLWLPSLLRLAQYDRQLEDYVPKERNSLLKLAEGDKRLYISTCHALCDYDPADVSHCFRPLPRLAEQVEETARLFAPLTLGVHIRRTDNKQAILNSPLQAFRQKTADFLKQPGSKVFLCTDDNSVKTYFRQLFGDRLVTRRACLKRNSLHGMQDAVIDLWALARTSKVLGSYYSSFSDTATELGGQPLETIFASSDKP